jgi:DNA-binding CsgD family transcriptional regulator
MNEGASLALAGMIGCVGSADFGSAALAHLNRALPLCWLSVYKLFPDAPPRMYASGSHGVADRTSDAFTAYRNGLYARDQTFLAAEERVRHGGAALTHWHALEIPVEHRRPIYSKHGLSERASLVVCESDGSVLAINLYRSESQPQFGDADIDLLCQWGAPLLATVQLHIRSTTVAPARVTQGGAAARVTTDIPARLSALCKLPRREREVCERLLRGWTYDGIAVDLGISAGTVKTYRDRAFERLQLHHRNELFALVLTAD